MTRPKIVTDKHLEYLDELRESGITNMYAAPRYLENAFDIDRETAGTIWSYWKETFGLRKAKQ